MGEIILFIMAIIIGACLGARLAINAVIEDLYDKHRINGSEREYMKSDDYLRELTSKP